MKRTNAILLLSCICLHAPSAWGQSAEPTDSLVHELQEVIVAARQPATKLVGTTLVTSIPGSNLADIGNALDVLAQLPMIKVEADKVSVIGKNNIEVYIDGRPMRDDKELRRLLSSSLKKVELLMAPGAAYESTTGAVLRITTKRNFMQGLSLTDQFQLARRRQWSLMNLLGLSYRIGNWEFFLDASLNRSNPLLKGTTTNTLLYDGQETMVGSRQNIIYTTTAGSIKVGLNYAKGSRSLGAYYRFNPERGDFSNDGAEWLDDNASLLRRIDRGIRGIAIWCRCIMRTLSPTTVCCILMATSVNRAITAAWRQLIRNPPIQMSTPAVCASQPFGQASYTFSSRWEKETSQ